MSDERVRLLIVDDHEVVRMGLRALFDTVPEFNVVGEASTCQGAIAEAQRCRPDVVIMDLRLPDGSGVEACRDIISQDPNTRVVVLTSYADEEALVTSIIAGAAGYVLKDSDSARLIDAIRTAATGRSLLDPAVTDTILDWMRNLASGNQPAAPLAGLSQQERRILSLIAEGKTNREIAAAVYLSGHTVRTYVSEIFRKLGVARRAQAAAYLARVERRATD